MRTPNYKLGWFVPHQVAALTHFHADVTTDDFMGVIQAGERLLADVHDEFHIIIDNRVVEMQEPAKLSQMQELVPYMTHPQLQWVVVVKPAHLALDTSSLPVEQAGDVRLKNVSTLAEAVAQLQAVTKGIAWADADPAFFPNAALTIPNGSD